MLGDQSQHLFHLGAELAVGVGDPDPLGAAAASALRVVAARPPVHLGVVAGVDRRHPDLLATEAERRFHGRGIDAADVVVEHDAAVDLDAGHHPLHEVGTRNRVLVMALEDDRFHARRAGRLHYVEVVRQAREQVRVGVTVQVGGTGHVDERTAVGTSGHVGLLSVSFPRRLSACGEAEFPPGT